MLPTVRVSEHVFYDPTSYTIFLTIDNVTMSLTLAQYCELHQSMQESSKVLSNLIAVSTAANKILNSPKVSDNYINSGSSKI